MIRSGAVWAVSRRTTRRFFLLNPDGKGEMEQLFWYALGVAKIEHDVEVHAACLMSTHTHLVLSDPRGELPRFLQCFHRYLALSTKALRGWTGEVFDKRSTNAHELVGTAAMVKSLGYLMANPVAAKAVRFAKDWPGAQTLPHELGRRVVRASRPAYFYDPSNERWPDEVEIALTVPSALREQVGEQNTRRSVAAYLRDAERAALREVQRSGRAFAGVRKVLRQSWRKFAASEEDGGRVQPQFAAAGDRPAQAMAIAAHRHFRRAYRDALARWCDGDRDAVFPYGTWWLAQFHGVHVEPPT